jgi:hypothetical protein
MTAATGRMRSMAPKKVKPASKKVRSLPAKSLTARHAKSVKGGALKGKEKWIP